MRKYRMCFNILAFCVGLFFSALIIPQALFAQSDNGIELFHAGAYDDAESKLRDTLKADPSKTTERYYLGLTLLNQEKYPEGLKELQTVKSEQEKASQRSRPAVPNVYQIDFALAQAYLALDQFDKAWPKLESARIEDSSSSEVFLYRGIYYYKQKEYSMAIKDLEKAITLDPQNTYAYYYAGHAYFDSDNIEKMVEAFQMFLELAPDAAEAGDVQTKIAPYC